MIKYIHTENYHTHLAVDPTILVLHQAAKDNEVAKLKKLIQVDKLEVDSRDDWMKTPLMIAATEGHLEILNFLLASGASATATDRDGSTPQVWAARRGNAEIFHILIQHITKNNLKKDDAQNLLHYAAVGGSIDIIRECQSLGADINKAWATETPLMVAAKFGHTEACKALVNMGAKVDAKGIGSDNPLLLAAGSGHTETVRELVAMGAKLEVRDMLKHTPLALAAYSGHLETVKLLISLGANVGAKDMVGNSARALAKEKGHDDVVEELGKYKSGCSIQ